MGKTHFPRTGGQQWTDSLYRYGAPTGDIRYVHSSGSSTGPGFSPETAYTTVKLAVAASTADNDDAVVVLPDHTETITAAAGLAITVAGVRVIGLGVGRNRPRFTFTTADAASFDVTAARCSFENCVLINGRDGQTAMVNVSAADFVFQDNEVQVADGTTQAVLGILTTASADRMIVRRNFFHGGGTAGTSSCVTIVGGDAILIEDNVMVGAFATTGNIGNITTAATMLVIRRNHLLNTTADGNNKVVVADASTTGLIVHNSGGIIDSMSPAPVTAAAMFVGGNHWSSAAGVTASVLM